MHLIWGMMNALTLVRYALKFNVLVPGNAYLFFYNMDVFLSMKAEFITELMAKVQRSIFKSNNGNNSLMKISSYIFAGIGLAIAIITTLILYSIRKNHIWI